MKFKIDNRIVGISIVLLASIWLIVSLMCPDCCVVVCPTKLIYDIPCPACGTTQAFRLLISGRFTESIALNPNAIIITVISIYSILATFIDIIQKKEIFCTINYSMNYLFGKPLFWIIFVASEAIIWARALSNAKELL